MLLVFLQPDLGTALVYIAALAAVLFVAGTRWLHLALLAALALALVAGGLAIGALAAAALTRVLASVLTSFAAVDPLMVAVAAALMLSNDRGALFFGLILPHGLLELTAVFVAGGVGLRLFWSWWNRVRWAGSSRSPRRAAPPSPWPWG